MTSDIRHHQGWTMWSIESGNLSLIGADGQVARIANEVVVQALIAIGAVLPVAAPKPEERGELIEYEICNPSDPYTLKAPSLVLAAATVTLLGNGQYPLVLDGETVVPLFAFGGFNEWWKAHSPDLSFADYIEANKGALAEVLESVAMPEGHERTSMNDIGREAQRIATLFQEEVS